MISLQSLLELDDATILTGSDTSGQRYLGQMLSHYSLVYGQTCFSCSKRFPEYLKQLRNHIMVKDNQKPASAYALEAGVTIPIFGTSEAYSAENMTDEAALKILSRNPNAAKLFSSLPENWEEQVEAYKLGETKVKDLDEIAKLTANQIRALFPQATGRSKADLLKSISELYPELNGKGEGSAPDAGGNDNEGEGSAPDAGE